MAIGLVMQFKGLVESKYEALMNETGLTGEKSWWPPGLVSRTAGTTADGWCVVDVWHSRKSFESYVTARLAPALARVGDVPRPEITPFEVHTVYRDW